MQTTIAPASRARHREARSLYRSVLTWLFTVFSSVRVVTYLPAIAAIVASGDSSQHSLWTWGTWLGSNLTMAIWLWEQNGRHANQAVWANLCNECPSGDHRPLERGHGAEARP